MKPRSFFSSPYFFEGVILTLSLLLPAVVLGQLGYPRYGLLMSVGVLLTSIPDTPGARKHRFNATVFCCLTVTLVAFITGLIPENDILLGTEIVLFGFFFSMFAVYGPRVASIGTAALLCMVLVMGTHRYGVPLLSYCGLLLAGGLWYISLSTLVSWIWPYRHLRHTLAECMHEVAEFLRVKASFYELDIPEEQAYRNMLAQQVKVNEKQEIMRELLFRGRPPADIADPSLLRPLETFVQLVDLYEAAMMMYHDYSPLRSQLAGTGILEIISAQARGIANSLDQMRVAINSQKRFKPVSDLKAGLAELQSKIDDLERSGHPAANLPLDGIVHNLEDLRRRIQNMQDFLLRSEDSFGSGPLGDYSRFIIPGDYSASNFLENLTFRSGIFRHSLRVAFVCLAGFAISRILYYGTHSYWILITILVILKPAFSQTKERNIQRILGTIAGGIIGVLILLVVKDKRTIFGLMMMFMIGTFSFQRINYTVNVLFMTPFVLLMLHLMGSGHLNLAWERIADTLIGSALAFPASYIILPIWESKNIGKFMQEVLRANYNYLFRLSKYLSGQTVSLSDYKLARKEAYVAAANLSSAYQRMLSEPRGKRRNSEQIYKFMVLNHILMANIASAATAGASGHVHLYSREILEPETQALSHMRAAYFEMGGNKDLPAIPVIADSGTEDILLEQQMQFLERICADIHSLATNYSMDE